MNFSVIYSFDCQRSIPVGQFLPPKSQRKLWQQTEGDEQYEYSYLGEEYKKGKHRKLCAMLTRKQFDEFVKHCDLRAETTETMGSLGAPGMGMGWSPAISFRAQDVNAIDVGAYVTPIPSFEPVKRADDEPWGERAWNRIRRAILKVYGG